MVLPARGGVMGGDGKMYIYRGFILEFSKGRHFEKKLFCLYDGEGGGGVRRNTKREKKSDSLKNL